MVPIDEQYKNAVEETIQALSGKQQSSTLNLIFVTDLHHSCGGNQLRAARAIRELTSRLPLDLVLNGGDSAVNAPKDYVLSAQREIYQALQTPGVPLLNVKGNHDDNSIYGHNQQGLRGLNVIYPSETRLLIQEGVLHAASWDDARPDSLYYFVDVEAKKTRVIVLDTTDIPYADSKDGNIKYFGQWEYAFSSGQLNWLAHKALNLTGKSGWRILIVSHVAIVQEGVHGTDYPVKNGEALWELVKAFREGGSYSSEGGAGEFAYRVSVDFKHQGNGTVVGCLFGHVHFDQTVYRNGIPMISSLNACTNQDFPESPERTPETISETAFDIMTVDFERSCIDAYRFGAGELRTISF
ncbi:metallophosphoesterase family protein [Cohnella fermenti]|uniref:Calcineurin-like phosphoesterase domain-containing protein n=1 Tax=Cohnella fermenti TaxID=2565925 RepID=A0A4S4CAM4_9BACL|nr:metallophosphoesterase [Cohnella fermenti]THF84483.1 hypothetical protein E6C55_00415 [Cohnella fermenti]